MYKIKTSLFIVCTLLSLQVYAKTMIENYMHILPNPLYEGVAPEMVLNITVQKSKMDAPYSVIVAQGGSKIINGKVLSAKIEIDGLTDNLSCFPKGQGFVCPSQVLTNSCIMKMNKDGKNVGVSGTGVLSLVDAHNGFVGFNGSSIACGYLF